MRCNFYFLLYLSVNSLILLVHCKSIPNNNAVSDAYTTVKNKNENYEISVKQENVNEAKNLSRQLIQLHQNKIADESKQIAQIVKNITQESIKLNLEFINNIACNVSYNNVTIKENYMDAIKSLINVNVSLEILIESLNVQNANKSKNLLQQVQEKYQNQKKILNQSIPCNGSNTYVNFRNEMLNILSVFGNKTEDIADTLSSNIINYKEEIILDLQTTVSNVKHCIEILIKLPYNTDISHGKPNIRIYYLCTKKNIECGFNFIDYHRTSKKDDEYAFQHCYYRDGDSTNSELKCNNCYCKQCRLYKCNRSISHECI
ncbi:uncharacterized protein LOC127278127 isoform X2 [Leptopilina boulardi]|uniref:uncharacterized protein LOC127278127 isoform X2 n=1 Tax=Leptopilina boulardi TaxID=63433 RepID=UPI0021F61026|nr:uncharacterized protein LOC127278127 isoform X2 [Leptopilina boulardi]